jgi:signal peptidase I
MSTEPEKEALPEEKTETDNQASTNAKPKKDAKKEMISWILTIVTAVVAAFLIRTFLFEPIRVDGESMTDTLLDKELVFVTKPEYYLGSPSRQDVIICKYPGRHNQYFVKRLIALPGDTVEIKYDRQTGTNTLYVNGEAVDEPYLTPERNNSNNAMAPLTLGPDEYFVMGDNRDNSNDSRYIGPISRSEIIGHVRFVFFPFNEMRNIE